MEKLESQIEEMREEWLDNVFDDESKMPAT